MPIVAPDILLQPGVLPPFGITLSAIRPTATIESSGRSSTVSTLTGRVDCSPVDAYGDVVGAEHVLAPGAPLAFAADARWRLTWSGDAGDGATLSFT